METRPKIEKGKFFLAIEKQEKFDPFSNDKIETRFNPYLARVVDIRHEEEDIVVDFNRLVRDPTKKSVDYPSIPVSKIMEDGRISNRLFIKPL